MLESEYWALAVSMGLRTLDEAIHASIGDVSTRYNTIFIYSDGTAIIIENNIPVPINENTLSM